MSAVYKIVEAAAWAEVGGPWTGSALDVADGYIHLSAAEQLAGTLAKHYPGVTGLLLLELDPSALPGLRWEPSRGGQRFPHLYGALDPAQVVARYPLELAPDGRHRLPFS